MPVRNGAAHVRSALHDLTGQTLRDLEIVVVDDASTDETVAVVDAVGDPRVRVVAGAGTGIVDALRRGVDAARAPYLARMDADDRCRPDRLARQADLLDARPEVVLVGSAFAVVDPAGRVERVEVLPTDDAALRRSLWVRNPFAHGSVMVRRSAYDAVGGYRADRPAAEDYDLWCRLATVGPLAALPAVLYDWQRSATGTSARLADVQRASMAAALAARWADGPPPLDDRHTLAARHARAVAEGPPGAAERADELELAVVVGLARHGRGRRAAAQLGAFLASRPGAVGAASVYAASGGRVTRVHRVLAGVRRRVR